MGHQVNILYVSYFHGFSRPHLHSQILPHIERLSELGYHYTVVTTEPISTTEVEQARISEARERLNAAGADYIELQRTGVAQGFVKIFGLARTLKSTKNLDIIHARSLLSGLIVAVVACLLRRRWMYDPRVVQADVAILKSKSVRSKLRRYTYIFVDLLLAILSDVMRVESDNHMCWYLNHLPTWLHRYTRFVVDVNSTDTALFRYDKFHRAYVRTMFGVPNERPIIAYVGAVLGKRNLKEMCDFVKGFDINEQRSIYLIITHHDTDKVKSAVKDFGLANDDVIVMSLLHSKVPKYLAAADAGIVFLDPSIYSYSFPLKVSEYLAVGLPVVINKGFGGVDRLVEAHNVGIALDDMNTTSFKLSYANLQMLLLDVEDTRIRCRGLAVAKLSIDASVNRMQRAYASLSP